MLPHRHKSLVKGKRFIRDAVKPESIHLKHSLLLNFFCISSSNRCLFVNLHTHFIPLYSRLMNHINVASTLRILLLRF